MLAMDYLIFGQINAMVIVQKDKPYVRRPMI